MKSKGDLFEKFVSETIHKKNNPLLVSDKLLRKRNMGQIDIGYIDRGQLNIAECKIGSSRVSRFQYRRLVKSAEFIQLILDQRVNLIGIQQVAKLNDAEYPFKICNIRELM